MYQLKIEPEFKSLIPPLTEEELQQLEQNILAEGKCRDAIKVWRDYIVDGHNRYEICQRHGISFNVKKIRFASKTDAKVWIADNQLGRRNLTPAMRIDIAVKKAELIGQGNRKQIAEAAGVSESNVYKYMKIAGSGSAELVEQVRSGAVKIGTAYKDVYVDTTTVEVLYAANLQYVKMISHITKLEQLYGFLSENTEVSRVKHRLEKQRDAVNAMTIIDE